MKAAGKFSSFILFSWLKVWNLIAGAKMETVATCTVIGIK